VLDEEAKSELGEKLGLGLFAVLVHHISNGAETNWCILGHGLCVIFLVLVTKYN